MQLIGLKKCSTCRDIEKLLARHQLTYTYREINLDNPTATELAQWYQQSGETTRKKFVNTSGLKYKELGLKDKWEHLSEAEQWALLATDGMLVKRPILITEDQQVYVGPAVKRYLDTLAN